MEQYKEDAMATYMKVFKIWECSKDKASVEKTFQILTGIEFEFVFSHLGMLNSN